jgi:pyruvate oxidase
MVEALRWVRILGPDELEEGRCTTVHAGGRSLCVSRVAGRYGAIDDACPHRGAPLGSGSVLNGRVICPVHAWDFDPFTGSYRGGLASGLSAYQTEERDDGIYVALRVLGPHSVRPPKV